MIKAATIDEINPTFCRVLVFGNVLRQKDVIELSGLEPMSLVLGGFMVRTAGGYKMDARAHAELAKKADIK